MHPVAFLLGLLSVLLPLSAETYHETLTFSRLLNGDILFEIEISRSSDQAECQLHRGRKDSFSLDLFPLSILYLTQYYGINSFDYSMTQGSWLGEQWGALPIEKQVTQASGASLFALFDMTHPSSEAALYKTWYFHIIRNS
jgi:Gpi16 subunit, GPI transamidase component